MEQEFQIAMKSEVTKPRVFPACGGVKDAAGEIVDEKGEKRKPDGNRALVKDKLELSKECRECGKNIKNAKKALLCKCKIFFFCDTACLASSDHFTACTEKEPPTKFELKPFIQALSNKAGDTKQKPNMVTLNRKLEGFMDTVDHPDQIRTLAMADDPMAAWLVGTSYSNRIAMVAEGNKNVPHFHMMPASDLEKSVGETDEQAIKWFEIAAKGGLPQGMASLACKLWAENGLKTDKRMAFYWMAKAWETGEMDRDVWEEIENKGYLANEAKATYLTVINNADILRQNLHPTTVIGPNLSSLLLAARHQKLEMWLKIPGFEGNTPNGHTLYSCSWIKKLFNLCQSKSLRLTFVAGRAGTCGATTKMCLEKERDVNNVVFRQGEKDESCIDLEQVNKFSPDCWAAMERTKYLVTCLHTDDKLAGECLQCLQDCKQRSQAVAQGSYSLSITEVIPSYGYGARYTTEKEAIVQEVYKAYSKPEICCILQCFLTNPADLHPLFLAEDPNLYWPMIWYYGTAYNAILECCGDKIVKKVYGKLKQYRSQNLAKANLPMMLKPDALIVFPDSAAGEMRIACGSEVCPKLDHKEKFNKCLGCRIRRYCSHLCQKEDWGKHQKECKDMIRTATEVD